MNVVQSRNLCSISGGVSGGCSEHEPTQWLGENKLQIVVVLVDVLAWIVSRLFRAQVLSISFR